VGAIADLSETLKSLSGKASGKTKQDIMKWVLGLSIGLNLALMGVVFFLNDRYGLLAKAGRVVLGEGRLPVIAAPYEMNRNYQVRREMFHLDRNEAARVLMLGDSLTAQGEWNAMLGEPSVANRGIDGDTSAGLLARVGDDADFRGDAVVIWIGTNDVLQGEAAGPVVERIIKVAREKAKLTTEGTESAEEEARSTTDDTDGHGYSAGLRLTGQAGASEPDSLASKLTDSTVSESLTRYASSPASLHDTSHSPLVTAPEAPKIFVLSVPPIARWWEGARESNGAIREINAALAGSAPGVGYAFVDLHPVLADGDGFLRGDVTSDGVHLNAKGYEAVIQRLKEAGVWPMSED